MLQNDGAQASWTRLIRPGMVRPMTFLLSLMLPTSAFALTGARHGIGADVSAGVSLASVGARPHFGAMLGAGWWSGRWDDAYAIGRYWQVGVTGRFDTQFNGGVRIAPMLEARRGIEVLVAGVIPFVAGGIVTSTGGDPDDDGFGFTGRGGVIGKFRWHRRHGGTLRLEAGVDVLGGQPQFTGSLLLGFQFSQPFGKRSTTAVSEIEDATIPPPRQTGRSAETGPLARPSH